MKTRTFFASLLLAIAGLLLWPQALLSGLPQPMCVYYGQARDGYGLPYWTNAEVILLSGTNEVARQPVRGSISPGVNFALYVHLDDGRSATAYSTRALRSGTQVSIVVRDEHGQRTIMENQTVPPVGHPGDLILIHATAASDSDADGLPDPWELELIAWSRGTLQSLLDVHGADDWDADGMSNLQEYQAGTFAFLDYDFLAIDWLTTTPHQHLQLTFLSVMGKTYGLHTATSLAGPGWEPCPFALSDTGPLQLTPAEGNGDWLSLYVPMETTPRFFRLIAE
ncbi:MAG: hypothetical protein JXQ71_18115 [Verrucomicrobia bacterium]|nr:hypothetical protein [Verrucomicrobiota bacterium]